MDGVVWTSLIDVYFIQYTSTLCTHKLFIYIVIINILIYVKVYLLYIFAFFLIEMRKPQKVIITQSFFNKTGASC